MGLVFSMGSWEGHDKDKSKQHVVFFTQYAERGTAKTPHKLAVSQKKPDRLPLPPIFVQGRLLLVFGETIFL